MHRSRRALAAGLLVVLVAASCVSTSPGGRAEFSGVVVDQAGNGIAGARVGVNGTTTRSDARGAFRFGVRRAARYVLNIAHDDYADISYITHVPMRGNRWPLTRAQSATVDPTQPISLTDTRPELATKGIGGARFTLPANALVDPRGNPPAGSLRATIATLDVSRGEGPGDWAVRSDDGLTEGFLVSYGAVFIQFTDAAGAKYQIRNGMAGELTLPVIPSMAAHAPANPNARFWFYDTTDGYWKRIGPTSFDPAKKAYVGAVNHLSTINTDIAKFDAACLKVTVDPSIAAGSKLRIRYHSGGTAFGQAPVLVMNDPVNAVFRLPANTNVLLELLDASNVAFGDFVVEDPAGTALVNTVVNTGPAIASGLTLFPPPPFATCKPITIRRAVPQVELRINVLPFAPGDRDLPTDDYITWAPTFCLARLTSGPPSNIVLTNAAGGGDVNFAAYVEPWPVNTTATATTLALSLPGDGSWVPFVISGKFGSPSINDKDAIIEAHLNTAGGAIVGTKALMVRVRKDANTLTQSERARFLFAFRNFRNQLGQNYVQFQEMHRLAATAGDEAHGQPAFLPWHRAMLLHVERELQKIDPSVALHYWDWDAAAPNVFTADFMGAPLAPFSAASFAEPVFSITNPLNGWDTNLPFSTGELRRNRRNHAAAGGGDGWLKPLDHPIDDSLVDRANYGPRSTDTSFSTEVEQLSHDWGHVWPCGAGHVRFPTRSAADPLFYLLHSQIERQWAYWQRAQNRHGLISGGNLTFPAPAHYDNGGNWNDAGVTAWQRGSFLLDGMWPWDGTTGGAVGRGQRPINQAPPSPPAPADENVPTSRPLVSSLPFPATFQPHLWPSAASVPRPRDMIDYLGKFRPRDGLGFCYDDVNY